ncbi:hypothetical protein GBA52_019038 [Prunus armeniaca]|nr:hypothetical protein GBA52_019038 [Prunus armeniaca]
MGFIPPRTTSTREQEGSATSRNCNFHSQSDSDTPTDSLPLCEHVNANEQSPARSTLSHFSILILQ